MIVNLKTTSLKELEDYRNLGIKSRVKFGGDFKNTLKELMKLLEEDIRKDIISNYGVEYTEFGSKIFKIKIKDKDLMIDKLISCTLYSNKNDQIYGHITPLFHTAEKGQKPKKSEMKKFPLTDLDAIAKAITKKLGDVIEEF